MCLLPSAVRIPPDISWVEPGAVIIVLLTAYYAWRRRGGSAWARNVATWLCAATWVEFDLDWQSANQAYRELELTTLLVAATLTIDCYQRWQQGRRAFRAIATIRVNRSSEKRTNDYA